MAFDQPTRNRLARFVGDARALLSEEFTRQLQLDYGLDPETGAVTALEALTHLDDSRRETARILRTTLAHYLAGQTPPTGKAQADAARREVLGRIVREQAYTVLNRLCALRMAEARGLLVESIARGYQSKGFQLYARLAGTALGETGDAYRSYLFSLFDEFAVDLAVLFDRFSPQGRLFPREAALLQLLDALNHSEIAPLWAEDETLGWTYQYFNSDEERRQMRAESQAPRNSRELAVRNQFFTPRYVVEFLTDNTLGRLWYEMTQGQTALAETCRYLVRRPQEIFLAEGEAAPAIPEPEEELSQEDLLQQPVYIPYRARKDPREIRMLDPACGSMHFGLYAFDLFERIYEEAWDWEASEGALGGPHQPSPLDRRLPTADHRPLTADYPDKAALLRDVPRLIIEHNIHGIDIDPRAAQIAGLSLWLRAQRSWQAQGLKPQERPQIRRSNVVCAESMPGDKALLAEFTATLPYKVLGQLVELIFDKMALAGEAGSLLKIEEELTEAVEQARQAYNASRLQEKQAAGYLPGLELARAATLFDFADLPADAAGFWDEAEARVLAALETYAEQAQNGGGYQRRLFAQDAARGFAFIDVCRKRYDVVLMNPPYGEATSHLKAKMKQTYPLTYKDIYASFWERSLTQSAEKGFVGALTSRTFLQNSSFVPLREEVLFPQSALGVVADLGLGVLDAAFVETCATTLSKTNPQNKTLFIRAQGSNNAETLVEACQGKATLNVFCIHQTEFTKIEGAPITYWLPEKCRDLFQDTLHNLGSLATIRQGLATGDDFRFIRAWWEANEFEIGQSLKWQWLSKGGNYAPWFFSIHLLVDWADKGKAIRNFTDENGNERSRYRGFDQYFQPGLTYPFRTVKGFNVRLLPAGCIFTVQGPSIVANEKSLFELLGYLNSSVCRLFLQSLTSTGAWQVGAVQSVPFVSLDRKVTSEIVMRVIENIALLRQIESLDESSPYFVFPDFHTKNLHEIASEYCRKLTHSRTKQEENNNYIDKVYAESLGLDLNYLQMLLAFGSNELQSENDNESDDNSGIDIDMGSTISVVHYSFGTVVGRWDIRYATDEKPAPELPDPFAPLPVCPPGMLQNAQGLPAAPEDVPAEYPLRISWPGILVDDAGHGEDIEGRVREVLRVIWGERADAIEQEACAILGVPSLRAYFAAPARFFDEHLKRYSKSRRAAPIYWPLSTPSGSYTLWLYYHRLTDQTLYICVNDFVDPKLQALTRQLNGLRGKTRRSSDDERELERLSNLELELQGFREELLRLAAFWKPDLNDGVQITAAPLWRLFQHRGWQQRLRETWEKLEAGEYDWAHLALSLWPERVIPACARDRSFAIAHEVEALFWVEDGGKWRALGEPEAEIATQKQRLLQCNRESTRALLEALAEGPAQGVPAYQVCQHLAEGAWDDLPIARHFWPERVTEKLWDEPQLALQAGMFLPDKRTQAARKRFLKEQLASGAPELAGAFIAAFQDVEAPFEQAWAALARGAHDAQPLALALWPERVLEKCLYDVELAAAHDLRHFFWVRGTDGEWRRRKKLRQEIQEEVERRQRGASVAK